MKRSESISQSEQGMENPKRAEILRVKAGEGCFSTPKARKIEGTRRIMVHILGKQIVAISNQ